MNKVNVLGKLIPIKRCKKLKHSEVLGMYGGEVILLRPKYTSEELEQNTLIHEIAHALFDRLGLQLDPTVEEVIANGIGNVIAENFIVTPRNAKGS